MQQRFRRLAMFVGATSLATAGLFFAACSTDNGGSTPTTFDSSTPNKDGSKTDGGDPDDPDTSMTDGGTGTADCSTVPKLRTNTTAGGFFCAFYRGDAAADAGLASLSNCASGQTCCNPGIADGGTFNGMFPPAFCADGKNGDTLCTAQDTANGSDYQPGFFSNSWECNDTTSCPGATPLCCMTHSAYDNKAGGTVNVGKDTKFPTACNALKSFGMGGSHCVSGTNCPAGEIKLCSANDQNCGGGTTCTAFSGGGRDLGYCR